MRLIAFFLILVNVAYAVYWVLNPTPKAVDVSGNVGAVVMPGRPLVLAEELKSSEITRRVLDRGSNVTASATCWAYGPLTVDQASDLLARVTVYTKQAFVQTEQVSVGTDYQLLVGPYDQEDAALVALPGVRELVDDSFILGDGDKYYISVGIFKLKANADNAMTQVAVVGSVDVFQKEVPRSHDESWVLWPESAVDAPAQLFAPDFNELKLNGKLLKKPCEEVVQQG